jgi:hypothetical protein
VTDRATEKTLSTETGTDKNPTHSELFERLTVVTGTLIISLPLKKIEQIRKAGLVGPAF